MLVFLRQSKFKGNLSARLNQVDYGRTDKSTYCKSIVHMPVVASNTSLWKGSKPEWNVHCIDFTVWLQIDGQSWKNLNAVFV